MGGNIPATIIRVSCLLDSGKSAESIQALSLVDDLEIPESEWTPNVTSSMPAVDVSKEPGQWSVVYENLAGKHNINVQEEDAGELICFLSISNMIIHMWHPFYN